MRSIAGYGCEFFEGGIHGDLSLRARHPPVICPESRGWYSHSYSCARPLPGLPPEFREVLDFGETREPYSPVYTRMAW
jgi:hypothetical protein